ncbi:MAG: DUF488 domain-containing protein [Desulfobulbaceae bacterium]|nr:DUF488 domain-containing protein [Desulfobulbaceae bacterium]
MLFSIGHSNHNIELSLSLLRLHGITAICDVRSSPYSRYAPQFSRREFEPILIKAGVVYSFLGEEFGARSDDSGCYRDGKAQYELLAKQTKFSDGIRRVLRGMEKGFRMAFLCAEEDPIKCHRALLVSRAFFERGVPVSHIRADGNLESQEELEKRLLALFKLRELNLFQTRAQVIADAYWRQGQRVAYRDENICGEDLAV